MLTTLGKQPERMPKGFFKAVEFPALAMLDKQTGDHRLLKSEGAGSRDLPLSIKYASKTSAMGGHDTAEVSGALFEVTIDPETGKMSGKGFMLDDEHGRRHARLIFTGAMRGNSVDLTEVKARFVEDFDTGDYWIEFTSFKLGATTGVSTPAFAEAHATIDEMSDDELMASFIVDPMSPIVAPEPEEFSIVIVDEPEMFEVTASMTTLVSFDAFYRPEADKPTKITVDADGNVFGHLALWNTCHDGFAEKCMLVPRPRDGYASFNQPGPLTERGQVETGPIFALGGHRSAKTAPTIEQAYGGIENAWCDVRITEGRFGPWLSGLVRPGVPEEVVYAARASRISGHWVNGKLKAIVSVNVPGYDVPGSGEFNVDFSVPFSFATTEGVPELVASFPGCMEPPRNQMVLEFDQSNTAAVVDAITTLAASNSGSYFSVTPTTTTGVLGSQVYVYQGGDTTITPVEEIEPEGDELREWADQKLADLLADDRDEDDVV